MCATCLLPRTSTISTVVDHMLDVLDDDKSIVHKGVQRYRGSFSSGTVLNEVDLLSDDTSGQSHLRKGLDRYGGTPRRYSKQTVQSAKSCRVISLFCIGICAGFVVVVTVFLLFIHDPMSNRHVDSRNREKKVEPLEVPTLEHIHSGASSDHVERYLSIKKQVSASKSHKKSHNPRETAVSETIAILVRARENEVVNILLKSLAQNSLECDLKMYHVVVLCSFDPDESSPSYVSEEDRASAKDAFAGMKKNLDLAEDDGRADLVFVPVGGSNPCRVWNALGKEAFFKHDADYFLQMNDDNGIVSSCALSHLVKDLQQRPQYHLPRGKKKKVPKLGVVAPLDTGHPHLITKGFVSRQHFIMFQSFLPIAPKEDWCVDQEYWLSHVYGKQYTKVDHRVQIFDGDRHLDMKLPKHLDERQREWLSEEIKFGQLYVRSWIEAEGDPALKQEKQNIINRESSENVSYERQWWTVKRSYLKKNQVHRRRRHYTRSRRQRRRRHGHRWPLRYPALRNRPREAQLPFSHGAEDSQMIDTED